jgi:malate synthase
MQKNLDAQRQALQRARDELQKGIDNYEEPRGVPLAVFLRVIV